MNNETSEDWVAGVRSSFTAGALAEPPDWLRANARRLFGARLAGRSPSESSLPTSVCALLVFDSRRPGLAAVGVRSAGVSEGPWHLLYRGGDVDVDLLVRPNQDGHTLNVRGQALAVVGDFIGTGVVEAQWSDTPRQLADCVPPTVRSEVEPSGEFALANLERGRYDVCLNFGAYRIELSGVEF